MSQQYHTPERQENSDAAQPRFGTNMNMTVGTRSEDPLVCDFSVAHQWVFAPSSDRHVHVRPVPRLGGVALFLTLWCMVLLAHSIPVYLDASSWFSLSV